MSLPLFPVQQSLFRLSSAREMNWSWDSEGAACAKAVLCYMPYTSLSYGFIQPVNPLTPSLTFPFLGTSISRPRRVPDVLNSGYSSPSPKYRESQLHNDALPGGLRRAEGQAQGRGAERQGSAPSPALGPGFQALGMIHPSQR